MSGKKTLLASSIGVCTASAATAVAWAGSTDSHPIVAQLLTKNKSEGKIAALDAKETLYQSGKQLTISIGNKLTYEVSKGDTLYAIGLRYGVHYQELAQLNNIANPNKLTAGTKLKIPLAVKQYVSKGNEMVYQLCKKHKMSLQLFFKLNPKVNLLQPLEAGQKVLIVKKEKVVKKEPKLKNKHRVVVVSKRDKVSVGGFQFQWPVSGMITSNFGWRHGRMHKGLDIWSSKKAKQVIDASLSGKVIKAGYHGGYGNMVLVDHGGGWVTLYAHLSRILVSTGEHVGTGQRLGYMGQTGNATGYHLHFEVHRNGEVINPLRVLR
ncbi:peptidoglycan DD-metalloendopeptidase family protein [Shimazuella alba]|uniref:Peptidoglycan DD-metalloendopeptidase family protein n=1 Tax=Shimazuella alba TaxID=2690964 RepID=A0A6I4VST0_9BACL|nr:M23 family metallopeptidase [Shimazuella alba]MXQ52976.1 peptidoglycan DD-metalloendopeptidase family protein [Shimazuella alba]